MYLISLIFFPLYKNPSWSINDGCLVKLDIFLAFSSIESSKYRDCSFFESNPKNFILLYLLKDTINYIILLEVYICQVV